MHQTLQITPFMHVPDLNAALAFFVDVLGFRIVLPLVRRSSDRRSTRRFLLQKERIKSSRLVAFDIQLKR